MTIYGRSEELVSRCVECDLTEPESLASLGGSAPGLVDGILRVVSMVEDDLYAMLFGRLFKGVLGHYCFLAGNAFLQVDKCIP